jgi:hypothetical protein
MIPCLKCRWYLDHPSLNKYELIKGLCTSCGNKQCLSQIIQEERYEMSEMKKVEEGTFVYSKEFGRGIVTNPKSHAPYGKGHTDYVAVWFEDQIRAKRLHRKELFVRGDRVMAIGSNGKLWDTDEVFTFYSHLDHNPDSKKSYTMLAGNGYCHYEYDVKHYDPQHKTEEKRILETHDKIEELISDVEKINAIAKGLKNAVREVTHDFYEDRGY